MRAVVDQRTVPQPLLSGSGVLGNAVDPAATAAAVDGRSKTNDDDDSDDNYYNVDVDNGDVAAADNDR